MMLKKSLKVNMILNAIKGMLGIVFPLISFPYVSKVLGVTNLGKYNFANSIISYFVLFAALGIKTYAVREGARIRDSHEELERFSGQMFTINMISTVISYVLFALSLIFVSKFTEYKTILIILSIQIMFTTIGVEWIYTIFEDFFFITVLSVISHIISLALLFLLVRTESDLNTYVGILVIASVGTNIVNFFHCKKYCWLRLTKNTDWKKHIKPILILFAMQITTTIYISSDTTILGFMCSDKEVGIYSVSTKIYSILTTILSSVIIVSIPRLSSLLGKERRKDFEFVAKDIYGTLLTVVIPSIVGIILLRKQIILIISNTTYLAATPSLSILSITLLFCLCAWFWGQCILVPMQMERFVFIATLISAIVNISLNFILIPIWAENAAAVTTLIAEAVAFVIQWKIARQYVSFHGMWKVYLKITIGCMAILFISILFKPFENQMFLYTFMVVICSICAYFIIEVLLKNESVRSIFDILKKKMKAI